jgi:hypothetical protein
LVIALASAALGHKINNHPDNWRHEVLGLTDVAPVRITQVDFDKHQIEVPDSRGVWHYLPSYRS